MNIEEYVTTLDARNTSADNPVKGLGTSIKSKLKNIISQNPAMITHASFPEGSIENAQKLKEQFLEKFGFDAPKELIGFYELFDGYELRLNNGVKDEYDDEEEFVDEEELNEFPKRLTSLFGEGITFYGETVDMFDSGGKTIIPPSNKLFSDGNKPFDNPHDIDLYYFDYFSDFNQIMIGIKDKQINLYQVKYGVGELKKIREDFRLYFKKNIIRN